MSVQAALPTLVILAALCAYLCGRIADHRRAIRRMDADRVASAEFHARLAARDRALEAAWHDSPGSVGPGARTCPFCQQPTGVAYVWGTPVGWRCPAGHSGPGISITAVPLR